MSFWCGSLSGAMGGASGSGDGYVYAPYPHYVLIPGSPRRARDSKSSVLWRAFKVFLLALLLVVLGYFLFPRETQVEVKTISLQGISLHVGDKTSLIPTVYMDVSLDLRLKIINSNFFGVLYDKLVVEIFYRGDNLGSVESRGGEVPSRSMVMATAKLELLGAPLLNHAAALISDVANREVPMQTVTYFNGAVEMFSLRPKIKVKVYCNIIMDPIDKEVLNKTCSLLPLPFPVA